MLPNAPHGCKKYGDRDLERWVFHPKANRKGHKELDPIAPEQLAGRAHKQREALRLDSFWADKMERALCKPGELDTPINYTVDTVLEKVAIPYRVAAPMAWEYPYMFRQATGSPSDSQLVSYATGTALLH